MTKSTDNRPMSTREVASRFDTLAKQEKWFEIQDELFAEQAKSIEPANSPYFNNAEGKGPIHQKGEAWIKRVQEVHHLATSEPVVAGNHFAASREMDLTVDGIGRVQIHEIMLYEVREGQIVSEQFFY